MLTCCNLSVSPRIQAGGIQLLPLNQGPLTSNIIWLEEGWTRGHPNSAHIVSCLFMVTWLLIALSASLGWLLWPLAKASMLSVDPLQTCMLPILAPAPTLNILTQKCLCYRLFLKVWPVLSVDPAQMKQEMRWFSGSPQPSWPWKIPPWKSIHTTWVPTRLFAFRVRAKSPSSPLLDFQGFQHTPLPALLPQKTLKILITLLSCRGPGDPISYCRVSNLKSMDS